MKYASRTFATCAALWLATACQKPAEKKAPSAVEAPKDQAGATKPKTPTPVPPPYDLASPPADAETLPNGIKIKRMTPAAADAAPIGRNDTVLVHFTGWYVKDGKQFNNTRAHGQPAPMALGQLQPELAGALQAMKKGEKAMLWVPAEKNVTESSPQAKGSALEVEIMDVTPGLPVPALAPPPGAKKTKLGVFYEVVTEGKGTKLRNFDIAEYHLTAWDASGRQLETTSTTKRPVKEPVYRMSKGLADAIVLMVVGQKNRIWMPQEVAMVRQNAAPGLMTYELELVSVTPQKQPPATPSDVKAPPAKAATTPKGVFYKELVAGKGAGPTESDRVKVHYTGWTTDGRMFDSSAVRGEPAEFGVRGVIPGWTDALLLMKPGSKWRVWIPEALAYKGVPGKPAGMLVFDVELLEVLARPAPAATISAPAAPPDVAAPPADAKKTSAGVSYKILTPGKGDKQPSKSSQITIHYTGWTTDGKIFDSSVTRGKPATFPLSNLIAGWQDAVPLMTAGAKWRLWIPESLAYQGKPGSPAGMLVFDIELISFQ